MSPAQLKGVMMTAVRHSRDTGRSARDQSSDSRRRNRSGSPSRFSMSSDSVGRKGRSRSNDGQGQGNYSSKKGKHLKFAPSTNSTQTVEAQSEDDESGDDKELVDSVLHDYFDDWANK